MQSPAFPSSTSTQALPRLSASQTAAFPTETVWGLAALPTPTGLRALALAKGQQRQHKPAQVSCLTAETALSLCAEPSRVTVLADFWPGPLSVITRAHAEVPMHLAPNGWVGLRLPAHPVAQELLDINGGVLLTTSLNRSGEVPAHSEAEARALAIADFVLAGGPAPQGMASTVIRLEDGADSGWSLVRAGSVSTEAIAEALGCWPAIPLSSADV